MNRTDAEEIVRQVREVTWQHTGENEHLRRGILFLTRAISADNRDPGILHQAWLEYMEAPVEWSEKPAAHSVLRELADLYIEREAVRDDTLAELLSPSDQVGAR